MPANMVCTLNGAYELTSRECRRMGMYTLYIEGRDSIIKETPQELPRGVAQKSSLAEATSSASKDSIADVNKAVNTNDPVALQEFTEPAGVQYSIFVEDPETLKFLQSMVDRDDFY